MTPGPWRWIQEDQDHLELRSADDAVVLQVYESHGGGIAPDAPDAAVLAAAPDLLAALKALRDWSREEYQNNPRIDAQADAAIAKAEGTP